VKYGDFKHESDVTARYLDTLKLKIQNRSENFLIKMDFTQ